MFCLKYVCYSKIYENTLRHSLEVDSNHGLTEADLLICLNCRKTISAEDYATVLRHIHKTKFVRNCSLCKNKQLCNK